jgi:hypothetical protein
MDGLQPTASRRTHQQKSRTTRSGFRFLREDAYFFEQDVGAAGLRGAGCGFLQAVSIGWTGFWQVPVEGLGATTVGVVVGVVVVVVVVVPVVVPPVTTAAERENEAKTRAEQARSSFMVLAD